MATDAERNAANAEIDVLDANRLGGLRELRAHAKAETLAGRDARGREITLVANRLSRSRSKLAEARAKVLLTHSLAGPIAELRGLTGQAREAIEDLKDIANAIAAAERLIGIIGRVLALFG